MRFLHPVWFWVSLPVLLSVPVYGQAVVEYSVITAGSTLGAAGAKGAGKSIGAVFNKLNKVMEKAGESKPGTVPASSRLLTLTPDPQPDSEARTAVSGKQQAAPEGSETKPAPAPVDYTEIALGLTRKDLLSGFGEPSMKTTVLHGAQVVETFWYKPAKQDSVVVIVEDGKVTKVSRASSAGEQSAGVIVLR